MWFFYDLENHVVVRLKIQLEFLTPCDDASSFNNENNAPCLALNVVNGHDCASASERLGESVIVLL